MLKPPVIIIGAGRSGTNMLRDLLVSHSSFTTWPCDEINYIWRHGNRDFETDEFSRSMAREPVNAFVRRQFNMLAAKHRDQIVVEKTCANSLRCGFVHEIFPKARFIHIIRDGRDVAVSAALRWNAKLDLGYLFKKARYVPVSDLPYYALRYLKARIYRLTSGKSRLSTWGPKYQGMQQDFQQHELVVGCALQWQRCVAAATEQLAGVAQHQVMNVRYEEFTASPKEELQRIFDFLETEVCDDQLAGLASEVSSRSVGQWRTKLSPVQKSQMNQSVGDWLGRLGYQPN